MRSALAHFQTLPLKDATRQLHHAFQGIENKPFIIHPSSFILFTMPASTLCNDPLSDKRFDFPFVNPSYGYEWSKDFDAVTTREHMQNNTRVRQRLGQRGFKPETLPPLLHSSFSPFTFQSGQPFSRTQIPASLGFLAKNKHDGLVLRRNLIQTHYINTRLASRIRKPRIIREAFLLIAQRHASEIVWN